LTQSIYSNEGKCIENTYDAFGAEYGYISHSSKYDENERVIEATHKQYHTDFSFISHHVYEYSYDENGNIIKERTTEYDANGNVISSYDTEY